MVFKIGETKKIKIDSEEFKAELQMTDNGEYLLSEEDIFKFMTDALNKAGIETELRYEDTDYYLNIWDNTRIYLGIIPDDPHKGLIQAFMQLSNELGCISDVKSWYSYREGEHFFNIKFEEPKAMPEEENEIEE